MNMSRLDPAVQDVASRGMFRKVGNGSSVLFCLDCWVGDFHLKAKYTRLFSISQRKEARISDMGCWIDNSWHWNFLWRRQLF